MAENVTIFGKVADQYDALVAYDEKLLDDYVEGQGYSLSSMVVASGLSSLMKFSQMFVDVGRLGNGVFVHGGWKGALQDALRALNLAGGAGAVVGRVGKLLRFTQVGETCAWVAQANALRLTGQRWFITARQLAEKAGVTPQQWLQIVKDGTTVTGLERMTEALAKMGIPHATGAAKSLDDVLAAVKHFNNGVITFGVRFGDNAHRLYATWDRTAGLVIRDPNHLFKTYRSLGDLRKAFGNGVALNPTPIIYVHNAVLTQVAQTAAAVGEVAMTLEQLVPIALQYVPLAQTLAGEAETAAQSIDVRDKIADKQPMKVQARHTVAPGETLSRISDKYYRSPRKWPVIYNGNRGAIGKDPAKIRPGQQLVIPQLPAVRKGNPPPNGANVPMV
jgi:LysM repeat protein